MFAVSAVAKRNLQFLLKNTNSSSVIYRHLTAVKVVDYTFWQAGVAVRLC